MVKVNYCGTLGRDDWFGVQNPFQPRRVIRDDGKIEASGAKAPSRGCLHTGISETTQGGVGLAARSDSFFFYAIVGPKAGHACC